MMCLVKMPIFLQQTLKQLTFIIRQVIQAIDQPIFKIMSMNKRYGPSSLCMPRMSFTLDGKEKQLTAILGSCHCNS
jgi:hypothetical protein